MPSAWATASSCISALTQTIAQSDDGYVELAVRLARDRGFRDDVRAAVAAAMRDPAATDPARYAARSRTAYRAALDGGRSRRRSAMTLREEIDAATAHYAAGRFGAAVAPTARARALAPRNAEILHNLGVALAADEPSSTKPPRRLARRPRWRRLRPSPGSRSAISSSAATGWRRAEAAFAAAARVAPDSVEALYNLGYTRHERWRFADALAPLAAARALAPANEQVWYQLYNTRLARRRTRGRARRLPGLRGTGRDHAGLLRAALESVRTLGDAAREERCVQQVLALDYGAEDIATLAGFLMRLQYFDVGPLPT